MSPGKASSVLRLMEDAYGKGLTEVQANRECFRCVLQTAAQRPNVEDLGTLVDAVLAKMDEQFILPDSACYGAAIRTWKNSALNPDMYDYREMSVRRCLELLDRMRVAHNQSIVSQVRVATQNVNDVLEALCVSTNHKRIEQAELLLESLEAAAEAAAGRDEMRHDPRPNANSYRLVIDVWRTAQSIEKVPRAMAILWRMKESYDAIATNSQKPDIVEVFNAFVRVCGSVRPRGDKDDGAHVFREALAAVESMRSLKGLYPNAVSYAVLLEACKILLPLGKERLRVVEQVFHLACDEGMVDDGVLRELRSVASEEQYSKLVIAPSEIVEGTKMVPESWSRNALGGRVVTADGRRTKPLTVDGQLAITNAMREFQMRRLRDKRNRNLLQGGRLRNKLPAAMRVTSSGATES